MGYIRKMSSSTKTATSTKTPSSSRSASSKPSSPSRSSSKELVIPYVGEEINVLIEKEVKKIKLSEKEKIFFDDLIQKFINSVKKIKIKDNFHITTSDCAKVGGGVDLELKKEIDTYVDSLIQGGEHLKYEKEEKPRFGGIQDDHLEILSLDENDNFNFKQIESLKKNMEKKLDEISKVVFDKQFNEESILTSIDENLKDTKIELVVKDNKNTHTHKDIEIDLYDGKLSLKTNSFGKLGYHKYNKITNETTLGKKLKAFKNEITKKIKAYYNNLKTQEAQTVMKQNILANLPNKMRHEHAHKIENFNDRKSLIKNMFIILIIGIVIYTYMYLCNYIVL